MPELPEVETIARGIAPVMEGRCISRIWCGDKGLRIPFPLDLAQNVTGQNVLRVDRRAKYILCHLEHDRILAIHLGMSGRVRILPSGSNQPLGKHDHFEIVMEDGSRIILNDARRFGMVFDFPAVNFLVHPRFRHLGPEPLSADFSPEYLMRILQRKTGEIKPVIMDQQLVVGVGNIYACEALYRARISPLRKASTLEGEEIALLVKSIKEILSEAITAGGTTLRDHRTVEGGLGYFQQNLSVYGREKLACPACICDHCKECAVRRIVQAGRSTFYCPVIQV
jgi:formamidopyrimidine-DNA glycosylase